MTTPKCPRLTKYEEIAYIMIIYEKDCGRLLETFNPT